MSYITSIGIANPVHKLSQSSIANFMAKVMRLEADEERKMRALYRMTGIDTRHSVLADYGRERDFEFYPNQPTEGEFPSTRQRLQLYQRHAVHLSADAALQCFNKIPTFDRDAITHLVVVSCTGMYAPGLDIDLVKTLGLKSTVERTCINFMGCYAAFNAIKLADTFCRANTTSKVLVVCTELCSIHFQKENTEDNLLANALFADGSAALLVEGATRSGINLKPLSFFCDLAMEGERDMAWTVGDLGFEMRLSSYVPEVIRRGIRQLTASLLQKIKHNLSDISYYAIHPGGKKILEAIGHELQLSKSDNMHAYEVLRNYGNMSSPTVLFVLQAIYQKLNSADHQKKILSFAFGPGLTLESMVLEVEKVP
ncbi:MAG: type III polyketide synthase [Cytophagales bacterium]